MLPLIFATTTKGDTSAMQDCTGLWAAFAKPAYVGPELTPSDIPSPNGSVSVRASSLGLSLVSSGHSIDLQGQLVNPGLTEVLWSPDSRDFVVNVSDGGLVGSWDTYFYSVDQNLRPVSHDIESPIKPIANRFAKCNPAEQVNIGSVSWLNEGKELLLVAQVPPHSSCRNMGDIIGFRISVESWKVIEQDISEAKLRKRWGKVVGCMLVPGKALDHKLKRARPLPKQDE